MAFCTRLPHAARSTASSALTRRAGTIFSTYVFNVGATFKPLEWAAAFVAYGEGRESFSFGGTLNGVSDRPDSESTNFEIGAKLQDPESLVFPRYVAREARSHGAWPSSRLSTVR